MNMHPRRTNPSSRRTVLLTTVISLLTLLSAPVWANSPPVANAGADQNVYLGQPAFLSGSATDPDGDPIVVWDWEMESKPAGSLAMLDWIDIAPCLTVSGQEGGTGVGTEAREEATDMNLKQGQTPAWGRCLRA